MKVIVKNPNGTLNYIRYELDAKKFDREPFDKFDRLLKEKQGEYVEKYKGMNIIKTELRIYVFFNFG